MLEQTGAFVWYELMTNDLPAAQSFYRKVVGWEAQDASTTQFDYRIFNFRAAQIGGLIELPHEGRRMGAMPRWVGYVAVQDLVGTVERIKTLGGTVYLPPTDSNIGRVSVIADPQTATLALINGLKYGARPANPGELGRVGWHELLAAEGKTAFAFYSALFGWVKAEAEAATPEDSYQLFAAGDRTLGGMFTKFAATPVPFWLYYFDVADLDAATDAVRAEGGQVAQGPLQIWGDTWIARCIDPQGAMFALQGKRSKAAIDRAEPLSTLTWSADWGGISSRGRVVVPGKPKE